VRRYAGPTDQTPGPVPPADPEELLVPGEGERLEEIAHTIQEFALLNFTARASVGPDGDIVDAVAAGVNFLGEELEASFHDIEAQVADRTAELVLVTDELTRQTLHDRLTGLPNRTLFWDRLTHRISLVTRRYSAFAVLMIDLDNFKTVNDTLGHLAGDRLLVDVALRIRAALREGDSAARLGGDEFLVLLDAVASPEEALAVAERVGQAVQERSGDRSDPPDISISIGVAVSMGPSRTSDDMVAAADVAMYDAKRLGGARCVLYDEKRHGPTIHVPAEPAATSGHA
jgi:diguanylate cyclase (GGDEF)-like protein